MGWLFGGFAFSNKKSEIGIKEKHVASFVESLSGRGFDSPHLHQFLSKEEETILDEVVRWDGFREF